MCAEGGGGWVVVWSGGGSFALYLVHPFTFFGTRETMTRLFPGQVFDDDWLPLFVAIALGLTFLLAALNYRLFENPMRKRGVLIAAGVGQRVAPPGSGKSPAEEK